MPILRQTNDSMAADCFLFTEKHVDICYTATIVRMGEVRFKFTEIKMKMNSLSIPQLAGTKCLKHVSYPSATIGS